MATSEGGQRAAIPTFSLTERRSVFPKRYGQLATMVLRSQAMGGPERWTELFPVAMRHQARSSPTFGLD
jgi:hypothetical protein